MKVEELKQIKFSIDRRQALDVYCNFSAKVTFEDDYEYKGWKIGSMHFHIHDGNYRSAVCYLFCEDPEGVFTHASFPFKNIWGLTNKVYEAIEKVTSFMSWKNYSVLEKTSFSNDFEFFQYIEKFHDIVFWLENEFKSPTINDAHHKEIKEAVKSRLSEILEYKDKAFELYANDILEKFKD